MMHVHVHGCNVPAEAADFRTSNVTAPTFRLISLRPGRRGARSSDEVVARLEDAGVSW